MIDLYVCVGSSCHLKGSYIIIKKFQELIAKNHLEDSVALKASFCLQCCKDGVACKVNDKKITGLSVSNCEEIFQKEVLSLL